MSSLLVGCIMFILIVGNSNKAELKGILIMQSNTLSSLYKFSLTVLAFSTSKVISEGRKPK